jgi:hypothetical protein
MPRGGQQRRRAGHLAEVGRRDALAAVVLRRALADGGALGQHDVAVRRVGCSPPHEPIWTTTGVPQVARMCTGSTARAAP